jgi:hypothetical protein
VNLAVDRVFREYVVAHYGAESKLEQTDHGRCSLACAASMGRISIVMAVHKVGMSVASVLA